MLLLSYMKKSSAGFTLMEILVAVGIIGILSTMTLMSVSEAREDARDKQRMNDVTQLSLALRLYFDQKGAQSLIDCDGGVYIDGSDGLSGSMSTGSCPDAAEIISFLESYMGSIPHDPLGPDNPDYYYYYDNDHICQPGERVPLVFAANLEKIDSNAPAYCSSGDTENDGGFASTATINPSAPYLSIIGFTQRRVFVAEDTSGSGGSTKTFTSSSGGGTGGGK